VNTRPKIVTAAILHSFTLHVVTHLLPVRGLAHVVAPLRCRCAADGNTATRPLKPRPPSTKNQYTYYDSNHSIHPTSYSKKMPDTNYPLPSRESLLSQYVGCKLCDVPTPAVVLDRSKMIKNSDAMLNVCRELGVGFRAHVKSHKVRLLLQTWMHIPRRREGMGTGGDTDVQSRHLNCRNCKLATRHQRPSL
jgi:hypothetical protein